MKGRLTTLALLSAETEAMPEAGHTVQNVLVVDTATRRAVVAVVRDDHVLAAAFHEQPTMHGEQLFSMMDEVLAMSELGMSSIDLLAVGMGPGSFTGVRVGMAASKGLAFAQRIPMTGVLSLAAMAHAARRVVGMCPVVSLVDAKKNEVFVACFGSRGEMLAGPAHTHRDDVSSWIAAVPMIGDEPVVVGEVASGLVLERVKHVRAWECCLPGPQAMASLAIALWNERHEDQLDTLEPLYVRPPDITQPVYLASEPLVAVASVAEGRRELDERRGSP